MSRSTNIYAGDNYRPDIDGLRAIAVLSVIVHHAWPAVLPGGYMGVDVFFVISGFIITALILRKLQANNFSLPEFYARRMKRIFPALFVVMVVTAMACYFLFLPNDMRDFGKSVAATTLFIANLNFYGEVGYFDAPSFEKPLLHTWSLGVEEQFYLVWPLVLLLLWRRLRFIPLLASMLLLSGMAFVSMARLVTADPDGAFYLPQGRAWELLVGALLATTVSHFRLSRQLGQLVSAFAAVVLIMTLAATQQGGGVNLIALVLIVFATGILLITHATGAIATAVLAKRPLVLIGQMSFSLYLWHWPLLSISRYVNYGQPPDHMLLLSIVATFVVSYFSWRWIELPFRSAPVATSRNRRIVILSGGTASMLICVLGVSTYLSGGFPWRVPPHVLALDAYAAEEPSTRPFCHRWDPALPGEMRCDFGEQFAKHTELLLIGDSHADHYAPAFQYLADSLGYRGRVMTGSSCLPLFGLYHMTNDRTRNNCERYRADMLEYIERMAAPTVIVLAGRWATYIHGPIDQKASDSGYLAFGPDDPFSEEHSLRVFETLLARTAGYLVSLGHSVVIMGQTPEFGRKPLICVARQWMVQGDVATTCGIEAKRVREYLQPVSEKAAAVASIFDRVQFVDPTPLFCTQVTCSPTLDQTLAFRDDDHLNPRGAIEVGKYLRPVLSGYFDANERARY